MGRIEYFGINQNIKFRIPKIHWTHVLLTIPMFSRINVTDIKLIVVEHDGK